MKITLKVIGRDLFTMLHEQLGKLNSTFPRLSTQLEHFEWEIIEILAIRPEHLLSYPDMPSALLIDAQEPTYIEKIQLLEKKELTFIKDPPFLPIVMSPIVLIFRSHGVLAEAPDFPDFVADWICTPFLISDLARRVIASLRRKNILKTKLHFGSLTLVPDLRVLSYQSRGIHLTPSEYSLAELFLNQMGTVIPIKDLVMLFRSSGKSTEGSNIRVTIFQLRLKLEMLTKSHYTLGSVYKQGYVLRTKNRATPDPHSISERSATGSLMSGHH
ncbi:winged helix-turn-helix domain-containing protein [Noviherbaspirillum suwonense]|jgi:DNA-binding winged helix-turn-helix (wHTH) protein|uniref:Transcriptional regulatory protein, C terminal n=1 Tax=Noviherbaspirillum suwonense TaxID=1224511 RepID=A0ABY1PVF4_9BURK|nr:winged helix-turn-helix domain-containing protein [Noviherbaspirillum suwonense]SMP50189.1 Transcriptional regulatory protein, C terminal [Noviherbaspirillum suwonense]